MSRSTLIVARRRQFVFQVAAEILESRRLLSTSVSAFHGNSASLGTNLTETTLSPSNVNVNTFGKLYAAAVDGQVYAQPLYQPGVNITTGTSQGVHNVVYVATENDSLYAIDANSGTVLWKDSFLIANPALGSGVTVTTVPSQASPGVNDVNSTDINPQIGITSTPAIDAGYLYLTAKTKQVTTNGTNHAVYTLDKVNIGSGAITSIVIADTAYNTSNSTYTYTSGPYVLDADGKGAGEINQTIQATNASGGTVAVTHVVYFNALRQLDRSAVTIYNGNIYIAFASHGDNGPYHGWILAYSETSLAPTAVFNADPDGSDDGIWQGGGKISIDSQGNLYVETGNGTFDTTLIGANASTGFAGYPQFGDYGDSFIKISLDSATTGPNQVINPNGWGLKVSDYFTPQNQASLSSADQDLGSGAPIALPQTLGSVTLGGTTDPNLLVGSGKNGVIYLMDTSSMGEYHSNTDNVVQEIGGGVGGGGSYDTSALYYDGKSVYLIYSGKASYAQEYTIANGAISALTSASPESFSSFGGSPMVSASNTSNGVVWLIDSGAAELRALQADNLGNELYNSGQDSARDNFGTATKFSSVAVADGEVFAGTTNSLDIYGLVAPPTSPPTAPKSLSASTVSQAEINLAWTDTATNAFGYYVDESTNGGANWTQIATLGSTATSTGVGGLQPSSTYSFEVQAYNSLGNSAFTNVASATTTATATPPNFSAGFTNAASSMDLNGGTVVSGSGLVLTDGNNGETRTAFTTSAFSVQGFNTTFTFADNSGAAADGMSFVLQDSSPTAIGGGGGGLGYQGIPASISIKFDLYSNSGEGTDSTGLFVDGDIPTEPSGNVKAETTLDMTANGVVLSSGDLMQVNLAYNGVTLTETVTDEAHTTDVFTHNYTVNIPSFIGGGYAYLGFTGATGGLSATQTIKTWSYTVVAALPYTPSNFTVTPASGTELNLAWTDPYSQVTNYNVLELENGTYTQIAQEPGATTVCNVTQLNEGTTYHFEVVAVNSAGSSNPTSAVSGTTPVPPVDVSNLQFSNLTTSSVSITWTNNATNATGIDVVRQLESNNSQYVTTLPNTSTEFDDSGLIPGAEYDYEVTANNLAGPSEGVDVVFETIPAAPSTPTPTVTGTSITLNWAPYGHAISEWDVYRGTTPGGEAAQPIATDVSSNSFTDTNLTPGVTYYYTITAVDASGQGAPSAEANGTIAGALPVVLTGAVNYLRLDRNGSLDVYSNTTGTGTPVQYIPSSITVNGSATSSQLIVDFSAGDPLPVSGLNANGSAGGVSIAILGSDGTHTLSVNSNVATLDSTIPLNFIEATNITFDGSLGSDTLTQLAGSPALSFINTTSTDHLVVDSGSYTFAVPAAGAGIVPIYLGSVSIGSGATTILANAASHSDRSVLQLNTLSIAGSTNNWQGTLDLGDNDLDLINGDIPAVTNMIAEGYAAGAWTGNGIISSAAASDPTHLTTLGAILNTTDGTTQLYGTGAALGLFDSLSPAATDVLIKFTYYGDTNLDGVVDGSDYSRIDTGFESATSGWFDGDLNYDNAIDGSDYTLIDNAFNSQAASLSASLSALPASKAAGPSTHAASKLKASASLSAVASKVFANTPISPLADTATSVASQVFDSDTVFTGQVNPLNDIRLKHQLA